MYGISVSAYPRADIVTSRLLILTFQVNGTGNGSGGSETELWDT